MNNNSLEKFACWEAERVGKVINREAVEMDSAAFLATHTPMVGLRYEVSEYEITDTSENGLLDILIQRSDKDEHTFVVLKGIPGTGKSHLIRWLKECFEAYAEQNSRNEVILLIRRANSSLRNTLRQIIETDIFDTPIFHSYLQRLQDATTQLSEAELSNRILNGLQEAALAVREEVYEPPTDRKFSQRITKDTPDFLMDAAVRQYLMRPGGAVERIGQFLTGEGRTSGEGEEMPQFVGEDLDFPEDVLRELNTVPYAAVRNMVGFLRTQSESVVAYLNSLLNYAVSNLTTLTADQLKDMFGDLRRQLRREGRSLTLFIEDITSFTGLDSALIDVLIAQHGVDDPEYCRLTSLVGVTDSYYNQSFRDNVRQRVTFLISLNLRQENEEVSQLLQSPDTVAEMVARYLNTIRLKEDDVSAWYKRDPDSNQLPNACISCSVLTECHRTFGMVQIGEGEDSQIGLYPFNKDALWTLYTHIDGQSTNRTPRALVNNILAYVLISHRRRIKEGHFPPPPRDLAMDVIPPMLVKPAQRQIIEAHAPTKVIAERIETLIRVWGNATIDTYEQDDEVYVGGLSKQVFDTFDLPFFRGDEIYAPPPVAVAPGVAADIPPRSEPVATLYAKDIENWRTGGRLEGYALLAGELASFVKSAIQWEILGISDTLVDERIRQARFEIEGQAGRAPVKPRFLFARSDEHALVLHALDVLHHERNPSPEQIATHTAILHIWLVQNTNTLIDFVRYIGADEASSSPDYDAVLTRVTYGLAVLAGEVVPSDISSSRELFLRLVASAMSPDKFVTVDNRNQERSEEWQKALIAIKDSGDRLRSEYLTMLNCPQGTSHNVIYLDAARGIQLTRDFKAIGLQMPMIDFPDTKSPAWALATDTHLKIAKRLPEVVEAERKSFYALREIITQHGGEQPEAVFAELTNFTQFTKKVVFEFPQPEDLTARKLANRLTDFDKLLEIEGDWVSLTHWLSSALKLKRELAAYRDYFQKLGRFLDGQLTRIGDELKSGQSDTVTAKRNAIQQILVELIDVADRLLNGE